MSHSLRKQAALSSGTTADTSVTLARQQQQSEHAVDGVGIVF